MFDSRSTWIGLQDRSRRRARLRHVMAYVAIFIVSVAVGALTAYFTTGGAR